LLHQALLIDAREYKRAVVIIRLHDRLTGRAAGWQDVDLAHLSATEAYLPPKSVYSQLAVIA
jgi:hypothetical protein